MRFSLNPCTRVERRAFEAKGAAKHCHARRFRLQPTHRVQQHHNNMPPETQSPVTINARHEDDVDEKTVLKLVAKSSGAAYSNQVRCYVLWSGSVGSRAVPAAHHLSKPILASRTHHSVCFHSNCACVAHVCVLCVGGHVQPLLLRCFHFAFILHIMFPLLITTALISSSRSSSLSPLTTHLHALATWRKTNTKQQEGAGNKKFANTPAEKVGAAYTNS